jgi:hypothetical protein
MHADDLGGDADHVARSLLLGHGRSASLPPVQSVHMRASVLATTRITAIHCNAVTVVRKSPRATTSPTMA